MTNQEWGTLAYTKSPKTSKRTTFQDELQAAVSARANKTLVDQYSDNFDEEEDDFLKNLLTSRKKKVNAFKTSKSKMVNFEISDDEDSPAKSKRISFLKTQRSGSHMESSRTDSPFDHSCSLSSKSFTSTDVCLDKRSDEVSINLRDQQENTQRSLTPAAEGVLQDTPLLLPSDTPEDAPESPTPSMKETFDTKQLTEKILPTPKPRQRVMAVNNNPQDKSSTFQDLNMPLELTYELTNQDHNSNFSEGMHDAGSRSRSQSFTSVGEHSVLTKSASDSGSKNCPNTEDTGNHSFSFEELTISQPPPTMQDSVDQRDCATNINSPISDNICNTPTSVSHPKRSLKVRGGSAKVVESKYLGSLSVLDRTVSLQNPESQADSVRAAVYQEWLLKKKEYLKQNMEMKKKEEVIKEKKKKDQEAKREDAVASYEAWKEKKLESMKIKIKEKQEQTRKADRTKEERDEKRQAAKQVFEKWKHEHDLLLKERWRKTRKDETEQNLQKQEKEEERKRSNNSAFFEWSEKKKNILHERAIAKRKELKDNTQTEHYLKEEKDKMALDMYENWLARKNLEKKQQQEQKWFQGILQDSPPPPWSPPSKIIPRRK